jgi:thioredoxin 1
MFNDEGFMDELTESDFDEYLSENEVVLVDFWAAWCMPCKIQTKMISGNKDQIPEGAKVAKVNVDNYPSLARRFNVRGIPQMYLFVQGKPVKGWTGVTQVSELINEMTRYT